MDTMSCGGHDEGDGEMEPIDVNADEVLYYSTQQGWWEDIDVVL